MGREGRGSPHQRSGLRRWLNISYYSGPLGGTNLEPLIEDAQCEMRMVGSHLDSASWSSTLVKYIYLDRVLR